MLLIQGEQDEYGNFTQLDLTAGQLPQTRQLRLGQCGHNTQSDRMMSHDVV